MKHVDIRDVRRVVRRANKTSEQVSFDRHLAYLKREI